MVDRSDPASSAHIPTPRFTGLATNVSAASPRGSYYPWFHRISISTMNLGWMSSSSPRAILMAPLSQFPIHAPKTQEINDEL
jgi:hypothetical protein